MNLLDCDALERKESPMTLDFYTFVSEAEQRKRQLEIDESPEAVDAMRNKGRRRSPEKRAMLANASARARAAGRAAVPAYY